MSKNMPSFFPLLEEADNFTLRRAVERLREGLFDPFGVSLLTARESQLNTMFDQGAQALAKNKGAHLCVCGSYGQGKSHSLTYLRQRALEQGFVVSSINLDPREVPLHDFRQVYRALMSQISFPEGDDSLVEVWARWIKGGYKKQLKGKKADPLTIIPECMPHVFKAVLTALASDDMELSKRQKALKKHATFRPREFPWILANSLNGNSPPLVRLRQALRYREVSFYKEQSLTCKGWEPYVDMVEALGLMFQQMGYKGWVLLFDEAEAIAQTRINMRRTSYAILQRFFCPDAQSSGLYPVFAFTDDFFATVKGEDYDRLDTRKIFEGKEQPYFGENYAKAWNRLKIYDLHDLSSKEWQTLAEKLIYLHAKAYDWQPEPKALQKQLAVTLKETGAREARLKIKALVNQLDFVHQGIVLG
ncbi:ATP-binding protein [Candidatus Electrothrix aarhusensis]